ncbi:MAG: phosphatidate cytidylyltransferase [Clostridia bacterium]|nr:phosphatidate cytidylyltransferase [Clostridia bacterium]
MKQRIITGIVMAAVGIPVLWFSDYFVFPLMIALMCVIAVFEMLRVHGCHNRYVLAIPAYVLAAALPFGAYIWLHVLAYAVADYIALLALAAVLYLLYMMFVAVLAQGQLSFADVAGIFTTSFYVIGAFSAAVLLRYMENGLYLIILALLGSWMCDISAYFVGTLIGKHKLVEKLSPKKTVEGSVGGILFSTLGCLLYGLILHTWFEVTPNYLILAVCGILLSVVSQIGDLFASLIKRERGVKDYGRIFPGHGGVMDRFDSILAVALVLFAVCLFAPPIV